MVTELDREPDPPGSCVIYFFRRVSCVEGSGPPPPPPTLVDLFVGLCFSHTERFLLFIHCMVCTFLTFVRRASKYYHGRRACVSFGTPDRPLPAGWTWNLLNLFTPTGGGSYRCLRACVKDAASYQYMHTLISNPGSRPALPP